MTDRISFVSVISKRGFLNLWINQIFVQLSFNALNFALLVWVFKLTDSIFAVSALFAAIYLPAVLLGLFSGVLVDISDRKNIIIMIDFFLALLFFSLIFFKGSFPAILLITFLVNALAQFYSPAEASAIPIVVKREELMTANSIFSATLYSCFLLGFGLSGPLMNQFGINFVFGFGGLLLTLAFLFALFFPSIKSEPDTQGKKLITALGRKNYGDILKIGITEILDTLYLIKGKLAVLTSMMILGGVQMGISVMAVLAPGFLEKSLEIKATDASYVLIMPLGLGIITGGMVLGRLGSNFIKRKLVSKGILFAGLLTFIVGIAPLISPAIRYFSHAKPLPFFYQPSLSKILFAGSFLMGIALISILIPSQTVLQQNTPEHDRGKVFAVLGVAMSALSLIPVLLVGVLADIFGTTPIFIGTGLLVIMAGLFGLRPNLFFREQSLPYKVKQFLGLGHWEEK